MTAIGFDVTGTITGYPRQCRALIEALHLAGWQVYVVSPNEIASIHRDLAEAGIDESWLTGIINSGHKGQAAKEHDMLALLDDDPSYLRQILEESPGTMPLQVLRL